MIDPVYFLSGLMLVFLAMQARETVRNRMKAKRERVEALTSSEL